MSIRTLTRLLLLPALLLAAVGCGHGGGKVTRVMEYHCLLPDSVRLQPGDVLFRRGEGFTSQVVLAADREGNYSHTGIVVDSCGTLLVVHAVPGEPDFEGDPDRVKADRPEHFFSTEFTSIGEVCRPADSTVASRAAEVAWQAYRRHTLFDHDFDDADTTRFYCTELIAHAFSRAGVDVVQGRSHHINLPTMQTDCVFPSDIYESDFLQSIAVF